MLSAADARAERAEKRADEAYQRAADALALADRLTGLLTDEAAKALRGELVAEQARRDADKARETVAEMEKQEVERKAKARWRRVWDGWRGV